MSHSKRAPNESVYQWLARIEAETTREIESEKEVEALIKSKAEQVGFKGLVRTNRTILFGVDCTKSEKVDGEWVVTPLEKNELYVGPDITRLSKTYRALPDVAYSIIETFVMHEDMHHKDDSAAKIRKKQVESGIGEYGKEKFELLSEDEQELFIHDNIFDSYANKAELDSQANEALYDKLLDSGIGKEQVVEKLAAEVWYVNTRPIADTISIKERESKLKGNVKEYLDDCFPFLEQKEEVVNKAMDIDRAYQKGLRKLDYVSNPKYRKSFNQVCK